MGMLPIASFMEVPRPSGHTSMSKSATDLPLLIQSPWLALSNSLAVSMEIMPSYKLAVLNFAEYFREQLEALLYLPPAGLHA